MTEHIPLITILRNYLQIIKLLAFLDYHPNPSDPAVEDLKLYMHPTFITGNQNKADYLAKMLGVPLEHQKLELEEIQSVDPFAVTEHKARSAYALVKKPVLVEDVSLTFTALGSLPGPFIKFFVDEENGLENLCRILDGFTDRSAHATVIYGYFDGKILQFFPGKLGGAIATQPRGDGGYGWDVIFEPAGYDGKTRAELSAEQDIESYGKMRDFDTLRAFLLKQLKNERFSLLPHKELY